MNSNIKTILSRGSCTPAQKKIAEEALTPSKFETLRKMEERGGEPTLIEFEGTLYFAELSEDSPRGSRDLYYNGAEKYARELGAELMEPAVYDSFRSKGITLDRNTWSWLRTTPEVRKTGYAFRGYYGGSYKYHANDHVQDRGLRCSLEVLKLEPQLPLSPYPSDTLAEVEIWLDECQGAFSSATRWRKEFLKFLKPLLK